MNVDGRTPKFQLIEAIKLLADYPSFAIMPVRGEQSEIAFRATLKDTCMSDSCAKALGWFDLQKRLERFRGVAVACANDDRVEPSQPRAPGMPGRPMPSPGGGPGGQPGTDPGQPPHLPVVSEI